MTSTTTSTTTSTIVQPAIDLADVQGNILRGYRMPDVRHIALSIGEPVQGRVFLSLLLTGDGDVPPIMTAEEWSERPTVCLNLAVSAPGLLALGVPQPTHDAFPNVFLAGSAQRALDTANDQASMAVGVGIGDIGDSAPDQWILGGPTTPVVHLLLSIWTDESSSPMREKVTAALVAAFTAHGLQEISRHDGNTFPNGTVHFGYRDGIAQPQIAGSPGDRTADQQPDTPTGDILIGNGYINAYGGNFLGSIPAELGTNGTYSAFRILEQHVDTFEQYITVTGERYDMDRELVAAKLCGRWRNGVPLAVSPATAQAPIAEAALNDFDFAPTPQNPTTYDDDVGLRCPVGAHIRRMNPRGATMTGMQHNHRIIRRGVPYGKQYDPANPNDGEQRGLLGVFLCGDLKNHFEFLMISWANMDLSLPGIRGSRDPIIGWQPSIGGKFKLPTGDDRGACAIADLPRLITTRGSLYLFVPGIKGLRTLAAG